MTLRGIRAVVACSALKQAYRNKLLRDGAGGDTEKMLFVRPTFDAPLKRVPAACACPAEWDQAQSPRVHRCYHGMMSTGRGWTLILQFSLTLLRVAPCLEGQRL